MQSGIVVFLGQGFHQVNEEFVACDAEQFFDLGGGDFAAAEGADLIEEGFGVPHTAFGFSGDQVDGVGGDGYFFLLGDPAELFGDLGLGNAAEIIALAAG